jgi:hypothetical protein
MPARDGQQLLLRAVAQAALPVAQAVIRHVGGVARRVGVAGEQLRGRIARADPVVQLAGGLGLPPGTVGGEGRAARWAGFVPQKAVAEAGNVEGHGRLGVAMRQLHIRLPSC